jgi:hypothetical protein
VAHKRRRRGRPREANARRRATTLAGRRPLVDFGSPELVARKRAVSNGSAAAVELIDYADILAVNDLLDREELVALRLVARWLVQLRRALNLPTASPHGLWAALASGQRAGQWAPPATVGGDRALLKLTELHLLFTRQLEVLGLIVRLAAGEAPPRTTDELVALRSGLRMVMEWQRHGRSRRPIEAV